MIERPVMYHAAKVETPTVPRETDRKLAFKDIVEAPKPGAVPDDPEPTAAHPDAVVEITIRLGQGVGQTLLLPWRLVANDALSQAATASAHAQLLAMTVRPARVERVAAGTVAAPVLRPYGAEMVGADSLGPPTEAAPSMSVHAIASTAAKVEAPPPPAVLAGAEPWQARLLRWLERPGNGVTARVRDYRLDAAGEAQLLDTLLAFARDNAVQLERVVVNAREVWRATQ